MKSKASLRPLPDHFNDDDAVMEHILGAVSGDDGYWPGRVRAAFEGAGFTIGRIQREGCHQSVWQVLLTCASCHLSRDKKVASTEIRRALRRNGLSITAGDLTVLEHRGAKLRCAFLFGPSGPPVDI